MYLLMFFFFMSLSVTILPQSRAETELITDKIIKRLENLEEHYLVKLNRRDFTRARGILDEVYFLLENLKTPALYAMDEKSFQGLKKKIKKESFTSNRLNIIRSAAGQNNFSVHQVLEVLDLLTYSDERIKGVEILYPWIIDKHNSLLLFEAMKFSSEKEVLRDIIERYK
jgi:hypothetical protein